MFYGIGVEHMAMQNGSKRNSGFALFLSLAFFLLLAPSSHAAATCGTVHPGSGTCTSPGGGFEQVNCASLAGQACCSVGPNCVWNTDDSTCSAGAGSHLAYCAAAENNQVRCQQMGCNWVPAPGACGANNGPSAYGEPCTSDSQCSRCLVCNTTAHKCTQLPNVCTVSPAIYVMPPPSSTSASGNEGPQSAIANLESGTQGVPGGSVVNGTSNIYKVGWFSDWKASGLIGVAIVCSIIALAAMIGRAFNLPEIKAFANNEIKQAVISVLLIASLIALVAFFDQTAYYAIQGSDLPVDCSGGQPCYVAAAKAYLTTLIDIGKGYAKDNMQESIEKMRRSTYGYNINANIIYLLYAGFSIRFNAGDSLVAERHGALFSQTSKILASLTAQRYFIDVVAFGIAPLFLLLGIVLRTFFFTRKLGGLLLALAISLFIIYPLTYAFAWYTLNVTVYGERTLAVADPFCPSECTTTYPTAFFTDPSTGQLVQFPTTQSIVRAGINKDNWGTGGPDLDNNGQPDFPGLVACRDLSSIAISAPDSCSECPDYCRDVPFPTSMPGCNITKCTSCNPGCKIVRQRLNCNTDPACPAGSCPDVCRTRVPTENKCFNDEKGGIIPANLSVSCSGCDKYPAWCRFLREEPAGTYKPVYDDHGDPAHGKPDIDKACTGIDTDPLCPKACSYITRLGQDTTCDAICSVTDASTGVSTVCPAECRVSQILNNSAWMDLYDVDPPNFAGICASTPEIAAACSVCKVHPECLIEVPAAPPANCSAYPLKNPVPQKCLSCPDYCRRDSFSNFFPAASNVERNPSTGTPAVCTGPGISCSTAGSPPACGAECRTSPATPLICRSFDPLHGADVSLCKACPDNARYEVKYVKNAPGYSCVNGIPTYLAPSSGNALLLPGAGTEATIGHGKPASGASQSKQAGMGLAADGTVPRNGTILLETADPPAMTLSRISPLVAYSGDPLSGFCTGTIMVGGTTAPANTIYFMGKGGTYDLAGGQLTYNFKWYRNNAVYSQGDTGGEFYPPNVEAPTENIAGGITAVGDIWKLSCQAVLGTDASGWLNSTPLTIQENPGEPPCTSTQVPIQLDSTPGKYDCSAASCPGACQKSDPVYVELPNEISSPACKDALQTGCPYGCRVFGLDGSLDPACATKCSSLLASSPQCFASSPAVPICNEYLGNGAASCHSSVCIGHASEGDCGSQSGCAWNAVGGYCDNAACPAITQNASCIGECSWMHTSEYSVIGERGTPTYSNTAACRQCPEQCRLDGYTGNCGVNSNGPSNLYVDCSVSACPAACRIPEPAAPSAPNCLAYPEVGQSCKGCPELCRRSSDLMSNVDSCTASSGCALSGNPLAGCMDQCRLPDPPVKPCEGCFECNMDCTYYPAIRSDCGDICSDSALAGPVDIAPSDFIKKLSGAQTSTDGQWTRQIGILYIPAVVLPLFCIVIVIAFVRIFSPILGGDIEIPGIGRII